MTDEQRAADWLLSAEAVRTQAGKVLAAGRAGRLRHFRIDESRLPATADYVVETMRQNYPDLDTPYHARWRHFIVDGLDRWAAFADPLALDPLDRARMDIDLVIVSVLLDAGAGADWRYLDRVTNEYMVRSEGLAIASLDAFCAAVFSDQDATVPRCDAEVLQALTQDRLGSAFQVSKSNPLEGLAGRTTLLNALGYICREKPQFFGPEGRPGGLADFLLSRARDGTIPAATVLKTVLAALGDIWPGRLSLADRNLGDCWYHPAATAEGPENGLVPFHKLSQWLSYSLVEPLQRLGLKVTGLDELTGLAEYRNGGLLIDSGVLSLKQQPAVQAPYFPDDELIVEWRALTVALLDEIADQVRQQLGLNSDDLPLASVLEGGTWAAGRRIAQEKRDGGGPPLSIVSDGSVF